MAADQEEVRKAAIAELAKRELANRASAQPVQDAGAEEAAEEPTFSTKVEGVWGRLKNLSVGEGLKGAGETALTAVTGIAGTIAAGYSGLTAASVQPVSKDDPAYDYIDQENFLMGKPTFTEKPDPKKTVEAVQEGFTYQPKTEGGQAIQDAIAIPFEEYEKRAYNLASGAGDEIENVPGATAAFTALMMLPAAIGMRRRSVAKKNKATTTETPALETLRQEADALYKRADAAKAAVKSDSFKSAMDAIERRLYEEGFDPGLHPKTAAAWNNLQGKVGNNQTLKGTEVNRKIINGARAANEADDARVASIMMDTYDDWLSSLSKNDMVFGDAAAAGIYKEARGLWSRKMKSDEIEWAIERAGIRAGQFTGSGFQNALVTEFRAIAMNKNRMRRFSANEQAAIKAVANGDKITNALRNLGRFALRGPVSGMSTILATSAGGPLVGGALAIAGEVGRLGATKRTASNARKASATMRQDPQGGQ